MQETEGNDAEDKKEENLNEQETYSTIGKPVAQGIHGIEERAFVIEQITIRECTLNPELSNGLEYKRVACIGIGIQERGGGGVNQHE